MAKYIDDRLAWLCTSCDCEVKTGMSLPWLQCPVCSAHMVRYRMAADRPAPASTTRKESP
jgi:predicted RNA-binding Zn-ribbon protein involved in translation (DUF1610 family)